jgi:cell wall-associated NlpC family hydrolase
MRDALIDYAKLFIGIPYIWGGAHPCQGYDCSGFIQEILHSVGLGPRTDMTASQLYYFLANNPNWHPVLEKGSILFFGKDERSISHTAIALNTYQMIEAGGGNSSTVSVEKAINNNAFIRIRPIRNDLVAALQYEGELWKP